MSLWMYLIKAFSIGFAIAAPLGPVGLLCIQETLEQGFKGAIYVGTGATLANALFGFIAGSGLTAISGFMLRAGVYLKLFGGAFLLWLAWKEFVAVAEKHVEVVDSVQSGFLKLSSKSFFLILTNPIVIMSFLSIFAGISGHATVTGQESLAIVLGVSIGSMLWWVILGYVVNKLQSHLSEEWLKRIRYISAGIIAWLGVITILSI